VQLTYPFDFFPEPGRAREVAPGVLWVRMPLPFALDHINLWLLQDGPGWTAVDTGVGLDGLKNCWRKLLPAYPLRRQMVTHWHPDHLGLAGWLEQETGAELWITESEYLTAQMVYAQIGSFGNAPMVEMFRQHGLDAQRVADMEKVSGTYRRHCAPLPASFRRLFDNEQIAVDGRVWRVMVGHGHSPEHAALYCEELKVLISGDMLLPRITTNVSTRPSNPNGNPLGLFLDSISRFEQLPPDVLVLPSHGTPFRGLHARIAELRQHHQERFAALLAALDRPMTAAELVPVLFSRSLDDAFQVMFAMGETIAHLKYLEHSRRLARVASNDCIRFDKLP